MEKEIEMDFNETRMAKQTEGTELSEKALEDATGGCRPGIGFLCEGCNRDCNTQPRIGRDGERLCAVCYQRRYGATYL